MGPMRLRAWGLIINFLFNGIALYGLSRLLSDQGGTPILVFGAVGTLVCISVLAIPDHS